MVGGHRLEHLGLGRSGDALEAAEEGGKVAARHLDCAGKLGLDVIARRGARALQLLHLRPDQVGDRIQQRGLLQERGERASLEEIVRQQKAQIEQLTMQNGWIMEELAKMRPGGGGS